MAQKLIKKLNSFKYLKNIRKLAITKRARNIAIIIILLISLAGLFYLNIGKFVVALVNNQPVTRLQLIQQLELQGGSQVLEALINKNLIQQEAKRNNVKITEFEVDEKVNEINDQLKEQGMDIETALSFQGQTLDSFKESIEFQLTIEALLDDQLKIDNSQIEESFEQNKDYYPEGTTLDEVRDDIIEQLKQQQLSTKYQELLTKLQENASIRKFVNF